MNLKKLIGAGHQVMMLALPVLALTVAGLVLKPAWFAVSGPLAVAGWPLLVLGFTGWLWSVVLILRDVPQNKLITTGPFRVVLHPLYLSIGLLLIPGLSLTLGSWAGIPFGLSIWLGAKLFGGSEEKQLKTNFGESYHQYRLKVLLPWL